MTTGKKVLAFILNFFFVGSGFIVIEGWKGFAKAAVWFLPFIILNVFRSEIGALWALLVLIGSYVHLIVMIKNPEKQKEIKFYEFEKLFNGDMLNYVKARWLTSRGNNYGEKGNLDRAIADFEEAIRIKPDHCPSYIGLSIAYREKGLYEKSLIVLKKTPRKMIVSNIEYGGFDFDIYNQAAAVYLQLGDKNKTVIFAKKALSVANDPKRKEQTEFLRKTGIFKEKEINDSMIINTWKEIINNLENKTRE